jgi:arsenate reductase
MSKAVQKMKILFLCTGNSCRSQMAEGWTRHLKGDRIEAHSAGVDPKRVDPLAVQVMAEAGVDIRGQHAKHVDQVKDIAFDFVVTVCDHAHEHCPLFPGRTRVVHVGFDDPPRLAMDARDEAERLGFYRRVRDEIEAFVDTLPEGLAGGDQAARWERIPKEDDV